MSTVGNVDGQTKCVTKFGEIDLLGATDYHKYLGRKFCGNLRLGHKSTIDHRVACAWMKYKSFQHVFENKMVSIFLF